MLPRAKLTARLNAGTYSGEILYRLVLDRGRCSEGVRCSGLFTSSGEGGSFLFEWLRCRVGWVLMRGSRGFGVGGRLEGERTRGGILGGERGDGRRGASGGIGGDGVGEGWDCCCGTWVRDMEEEVIVGVEGRWEGSSAEWVEPLEDRDGSGRGVLEETLRRGRRGEGEG